MNNPIDSGPPAPDELQRAMDPYTLLPGEDPETPYAEDSLHWLRVYGELLALKEELVATTEQSQERMTPDARAESDTDRRMLGAQRDRYRLRHDFWMQRARALGQSPPAPAAAERKG